MHTHARACIPAPFRTHARMHIRLSHVCLVTSPQSHYTHILINTFHLHRCRRISAWRPGVWRFLRTQTSFALSGSIQNTDALSPSTYRTVPCTDTFAVCLGPQARRIHSWLYPPRKAPAEIYVQLRHQSCRRPPLPWQHRVAKFRCFDITGHWCFASRQIPRMHLRTFTHCTRL